MSIYSKRSRTKVNYRKIYEDHYGAIPTDELGRSFDVHHIDGNSHNNSPDNLIAVSRQEHYQIHYDQGDFGAAQKIAFRLDMSREEEFEYLSDLASKINQQRLKDGTHNLSRRSDGSSMASDQVDKGINAFMTRSDGTNMATDRINDGSHPSQIMISCIHCHKTVNSMLFSRWHGENCLVVTSRYSSKRHRKSLEPVTIDGVTYKTKSAAMKALSLSKYELFKLINNITPKNHKRPVIIYGVAYISIAEACRSLSLSPYYVRKLIKKE